MNEVLKSNAKGLAVWCGVFALVLAAIAVCAPAHATQNGHGAQIYGSVKSSKGDAVAGAMVRLQARGAAQASEHSTDAQGKYAFANVEPGIYVVSAEKGGQHSKAVTVTLSGKSPQQRADLVLDAETSLSSDSKANSAQSMEFSDTPQFKIAGVTDWTAAGGHGSDAVLRASEAITRQALSYKPEDRAQSDAAEEASLRAAARKAPDNFDAQRKLGQFYLRSAQFAQAADTLKAAYRIHPEDKENEADLARACLGVGDVDEARTHANHLMSEGSQADAHRIEGEIAEQQGDPVRAVAEFQKAVELKPSEENYFAWGSELLVHRAIWQAKSVFEQATGLYPHSARLMTALGATLFAGALYDDAAYKLCSASDMNPNDVESYDLLGKIEIASPNPLPCVRTRLDRYLKVRPQSAMANYYVAMAIWKAGGGQAAKEPTLAQVQALLEHALSLDDSCAECWLQLGNIASARHDYPTAVADYQKAISRDAKMSDAHYRLAVAYDRLGRRDDARAQFALHDELAKESAAEVQQQRLQIKQFIVELPKNGDQQPR
ncbi:MAG: tetratricopeptide repeat protein [Acidobacteriota bacterium]|nr:tetratricopeptide repeat protein [Acidobacteriota bacterium]